MKSSLILSLAVILLFNSCKEDPEPKLGTKKTDYIGNQLRTDGYYSLTYDNGESRFLNYILYRDGTLLFGGSPLTSQISDRELDYNNGKWNEVAAPEKTFWGVFTIDASDITFDQWQLRDGGVLASYKTYGKVLNDTTFVMTSTTRYGFEDISLDEIYRFQPLTQKPDSINQFLD